MAPPTPMMPHGLGAQLIQKFNEAALSTEVLYSFIIIVISLVIYFSTKEIYELTNHKGIKYFRLAFLFFAISYFSRSFIKLILLNLDIRGAINIMNISIGQLSSFIFLYASAMSVLYILLSVLSKKWKNSQKIELIFHLVSILISAIIITLRNATYVLIIHLILLTFLTLATFIVHTESRKKKNSLYATYILLFLFWTINIIDLLTSTIFANLQLIIYIASTTIFITIFYKVMKNIGK